MLQDALEDSKRADVLERDIFLLSLVVGAIPGEIRTMQSRLYECEESVAEARDRISQACGDSGPELSDTIGAYYRLNKKNRECAALLATLGDEINERINVESETIRREVTTAAMQGGRPRTVVTETTTKTIRN